MLCAVTMQLDLNSICQKSGIATLISYFQENMYMITRKLFEHLHAFGVCTYKRKLKCKNGMNKKIIKPF